MNWKTLMLLTLQYFTKKPTESMQSLPKFQWLFLQKWKNQSSNLYETERPRSAKIILKMKIKAELTPHNSKLTTNSAQGKMYKLMEQTELGVVYGIQFPVLYSRSLFIFLYSSVCLLIPNS